MISQEDYDDYRSAHFGRRGTDEQMLLKWQSVHLMGDDEKKRVEAWLERQKVRTDG